MTDRITFIVSFFFIFISCSTTEQPAVQPEPEALEVSGAAAHWITADHLAWEPGTDAFSYALYYSQDADIDIFDTEVTGGAIIELKPVDAEIPEIQSRLRHLRERQIFEVNANLNEIRDAVKGQIIAVAFDGSGTPVAATHVQRHGVLDDLFYFDGTLGPIYHENSIELNLWAPTAQSVTLWIYDSEKNPVEELNPVEESPADGVWRFEGPADWDRMFYRFDIQVYHRQTNTVERYEVTDPYAFSLSTDSEFNQFVNLAEDPELKPHGWDSLVKQLPFPTDITLYEAHMRDFSIIDQTVPEEHRGTYRAFTHNGENGRNLSDGMNHLKELADAGLTHLHLLPVNDIASIIEDRSERVDLDDPYRLLCDRLGIDELSEECERYGSRPIRDVFEEMAEEDPVTLEIQNTLAARYPDHPARYDGFNWGYDPFHFNVPEGSYATDPDGIQRILEFREMVKALDEIGLKLVIDVVYNHTHATGLSPYSVLDKVVPDYYQRLNPDTGEVERSTCCANTAAEFRMKEKLIIDSVLLWAEHYKVDSFRFDLMGHHPRYVMENLQQALNELTVEEHGVDGKSIYIYGEGWNFGEVADNRIFDQATQFMTGGMGIGHFNDRIRDAVKGGFYSWTGRDQGFATGKYLFPNEESDASAEEKAILLDQADRIRVGMAGNLSTYRYVNRFGEVVDGGNEGIGYTLMPQETVNYLDKHDNETLWDNTQTKLPFDMQMDGRVRVHLLSNAFINYGQGIPFYQLGTDLLRSKSMDRDSYDSGDWYNAIDYTLETTRWGKGLPPAWRNEDSWDELRTIMQNENVNITSYHMNLTRDIFLDQIRVRYSSPLFRLQTAEEIHKRVAFHNTGPDQDPGLIVMSISDGVCAGESLDPNYDGILVLFNSDDEMKTVETGLTGMRLHPLLENGSDPVLKETIIHGSEIQIPALSGVVLVKTESGLQGDFVCNGVN